MVGILHVVKPDFKTDAYLLENKHPQLFKQAATYESIRQVHKLANKIPIQRSKRVETLPQSLCSLHRHRNMSH